MHEIGRLTRLELGYVGETNSRVIEIDVSEWLERWPDAIIVAWHERPDKYGYWANTSEEDGILSWTVHSGDVAVAGEGFLQVRAIMPEGDGKIYKSRVVRTRTYASLEEWLNDPDAPDPMEAWANVAAVARAEAVAARDEAEQHAYRAEESATMAEVAKDATLSYQDATYIYMGRAERAAESADQAQETTAQIAAAAGESANIATESATAAINSKIEAKEAAEQASEDADTAAAAKKTAVEAAEQAKVSEENSRKTASDASRGMANNNVIMDALVPYWGDNAVIEIGRPNYPAENIGVVRNGGTVVLNGTAGAMVRITMSGELAVTATNADFEALERTVDFFDGREYELELRKLSGTMTGDDLRCIVYKEGVEDPVGYTVFNPAVGKGVSRFTWDGVGSDGIVALRVPEGMTFEDCEMCVVITDVAARAEATADATAREGVAANAQSIKDLKAKQTDDHTDVTTMIASVADDVTPRVTEADRVTKNTDGHFWPILWTSATKIMTYTETDGVITEHTDKPLGSAIIPCPRNLFFDFENGTARIYLYFYTKNDDGSFTPNWDIVDLTASTGLKNYINSGQYGKTAIRDIPDGMYMQAAVPVGNVQLYGWDGEAFGPPLTTNANTVTSSGNTNSMMADGNGSVIIPGDAQYVITTDPKATLRMGIGVKDGVSTYLGSSATEFIKLPTGYDYFMYRLDPNSGIKTTWTGDASKYVAAVCDMQRNRLTETAAKYVIDAARKISEFQWTPAANIRIQGGGKEYYPGVTYNGIPYGSGWQVAHYVGWHVSAHTFLNAVADDASIMVMEGLADDGNAPYYSTVCSAFATMAAGWPHPALNDEMAINPKVKLIRTVTPPIGVVWSNIGKGGGKHCVIPERVDYIGDKVESISAYEGVPAATMRTTRYSNITDAEDKTRFKQAYGANYYDTYGAAAYHLEAVRDMSNIPYWDADTATVTGGDARPYRGDRSVYTSQMDSVLINIKNANAESLLLRNPSGGTHLIQINGATQIDVKSYMSEDGIYYVSTDTSFTEESFEYVSTEPLTYKCVNGQISFDRNDWWYVYVEYTPDRRNSYWPEKTKMVNVPCNADNDYRDWTAIGRFGKAYVAYYKGQYGAYTVPCVATEIWDDGVDNLVEKFRAGTGLSMEGRTLNAEVTQTDIEELRMLINQGGGSGGGSGGIVTETDPTVPARISEHNTDENAHSDLRLLLADLDKRLGTLADSDDTTLDQLSEIVAYIKNNKSLIDGITTGKISTADIVDNLTTNASNKPLSAAQGVELKKLIDAIVVPTKLSELSDDATHRLTTDTEKAAWNAKSTFSGKYEDLTGKPTIPTVTTASITSALGYTPANAETVTELSEEVDYYANYVTPQMFGAKGDGTTDDTAAMQAAFDDVAVNGKYLFIPKGRYKVTSPITIDWSSTSETKRNFLQKIIGAGSQAFEKDYDNSVIVGYNIPANRGVIELIGNGNTWGTETRIEDLGIECNKASCDPMSFALKYGDARNFKLSRVKLRGHNAVLARCGSIVDESGNSATKGYEQINVKFEQCDFYTFDDSTKGFAFLPEGVITGHHATMDNIVVDSCCISGVWVVTSVNIMFQSCQIFIPNIANKEITTDNVGRLNGYEVDYGTGFYVGQAMSAVFQNCYFEDHRRSFHITPTLGSVRNVSIMNCYMNPGSNQFAADGSRLNADYGVLISRGASDKQVRNVLVQNNVFRLEPNYDTAFVIASAKNECAEHFVFRDNCTTSTLEVPKVENKTTSGYDIRNGQDSGAAVKSMTTSSDGKTLTIELTNGKSITFNTGASAPVKGVDYFTAEEVEEIKESAAALAKAELQQIPPPTWVESVDDMTDTSKNYVLLETGNIWAYMTTRKTMPDVTVPAYTNLMDDPGAYIKEGYRYSQSGAAFKAQASDCAIVIPLSYIGECKLRVRGASIDGCAYPSTIYLGETNDAFPQVSQGSRSNSTDANGDLVVEFSTSASLNSGCKYAVFGVAAGVDASTLIVTLNEEIVDKTVPGGTEIVTDWTDTGHYIVQS